MNPKWTFFIVLAALLLLAGTRSVKAGPTATQTLRIEVRVVNEILLNGDPEPLVISMASPGSQALPVSDDSTTYSITNNESDKKITAQTSADLAPAAITLTIRLEAPEDAESLGEVSLSTTPRDVVTRITEVAQSGLRITYTLSATTASPVVSEVGIVTLTITPNT